MKNINMIISVFSLVVSSVVGIITYQQHQHIKILEQQLLEMAKLGTEHTKATRELTELVSRIAKESTLDVQLNKMFESTKDKIQESGQKLFDSTKESLEKLYPSTPEQPQ